MPDDTPAPPDLAAIRADYATLKPRERASTLTDAQERLLYEAVPALLAEVARIAALERALEHATLVIEQYELDIRNSDWTGVNLQAVGFCQGVIYRRARRTIQQLAQPKGGDNHARS